MRALGKFKSDNYRDINYVGDKDKSTELSVTLRRVDNA